MVSRFSAESEYQALTDTICELVCIQDLLIELHILSSTRMRLYCDNTSALHIAENLIFHEHTKHIEVDCLLVRHKITEEKSLNFNMFFCIC